jgi:hypothetical protein
LSPLGALIFLLTRFSPRSNMALDESDGSFGKQINWPLGLRFQIPMAFFCLAEAIS